MSIALIDPKRLSLARQAAGLKKKELADKISVSPASITQYEAGNTTPADATVAKIAIACGCPVEFLQYDGRTVIPSQISQPSFRSLRSTRALEREQALAKAILVWQVAKVLEEKVDFPDIDFPDLTVKEDASLEAAAAKADTLRKEWRLGSGPIRNVVSVLESHGALCAALSSGTDRIDAFSLHIAGRPFVIFWKTKADAARARFDAAHELGHLVLHPDPDPGNQIMERQAHAFAAAFLMPEVSVIDDLPRRAPRRSDIPGLVDVKLKWGASMAAIYFRSRELGVISKETHRRAMIRLSEFGFRKKEPGNLGRPESPSAFATAVRLLEENASMGIDDLSAESRLTEAQVREVCSVDPKLTVSPLPLGSNVVAGPWASR